MIKALLLIPFLAFSIFSIGQINFQSLTIDEAIAKAKKENKNVFIDIFTTWCGPCKLLDKNVFKNTEIGNRMNSKFVSIKVDAERYPDPQRLTEFAVRAYPTMIVLDGDGKIIKKIIGYRSVGQFHNELDAFIDPALLPKNVAKKAMENNPKNETIWRESMTILLEKDKMFFYENTQTFVDRFGLDELTNELDSTIFYNSVLPLDHPITQRILADDDYMPWAQEKYQKLDMRERARTAKTKEKYDAVVAEAKAFHAQLMTEYNGDFYTEEYFLKQVFPDDLNPVYLQEKPEKVKLTCADRKAERKKRREARRLERKSKK